MREHLSIGDDGSEFLWRDFSDSHEGTGSRPEEHFVLNNVADAGEDGLIEQHIGNFRTWKSADLFQCGLRIPSIGHDVGGEVVLALGVWTIDPFHRCRPDGDFAVWEIHHQPRRPSAPIVAGDGRPVDGRRERSPEHEMHTEREGVELEDQMFSPGEDVLHLFACKPVDPDATVPGDRGDGLSFEWF